MRTFGSLKLFFLATVALSFATACGHKYNKRPRHQVEDPDEPDAPKAKPKDEMRQGIAGPDQWLGLNQFGARIHIPLGWNWAQQGIAIVANSPKQTGSIAFIGAVNDEDMGEKLKKAFEVLKINPGEADSEPRKIVINGLNFVRLDYSRATAEGKPAHAIALAGGAPAKPGGYVIFVGFAQAGNEDSEEELRDSVNSLSSN
jgi:hypothetical protein